MSSFLKASHKDAMIAFLCFFLPPVFLMSIRGLVLRSHVPPLCQKRIMEIIQEYILTTLFLNFCVIAVTYKIFGHTGELIDAFDQYTSFTFHYLLLSLVLAMIGPIIENIIRFHLKIEVLHWQIKVDKSIILYVYAAILFFLNFIRVFDNAFWGDEGYSIRRAKMGMVQIIKATAAADVHPPLYYLWIRFLYLLSGDRGMTYHLSALIPYAFILIFSCIVIKRYFGKIPVVVFMTMSSLMGCAVTFNVEARMYSLAAMFVFLSFFSLYKIIQYDKLGDQVFFAVFSLCAAYTHYYALIAVAFFYLALIILAYVKRVSIKKTIITCIATIIAYLPWLSVLLRSFMRTARHWWLDSIPSIKECVLFVFDDMRVYMIFVVAVSIYILYQTGLLTIKINRGQPIIKWIDIKIRLGRWDSISNEAIWILAGLASVFGTLSVGLSLSYVVRPFLVLRYLFSVVPVAYLILGICLSRMHLKSVWTVVTLVLTLCVSFPGYINTYRDEKALDMATAKVLDIVVPGPDAMVCTNDTHLSWTLLEYYYPDTPRGYAQDATEILDGEYDEIWLFWKDGLDSGVKCAIAMQGFYYDEVYEGQFANGVYHIYKLCKR